MADPLTSPLQNVPSPPVTPQRRRNDKSVAAVQLLPSPDLSPLPSSPTSGYIQANEFIQRIRRRELGRLLREQCAFLITPAEHNKALLQLREPGSRLRGYFQDKFRYDYDFRTGQLRICMPSYTHDAFLSIVVRVIDDYISKARSDGGAVQRFANDVMASGTADIEHYAPEDVEYKPMEHSDTEAPGSSADDNNSESLNPTITTRRAHQMSLRATHHELSEETHVLREIQNLTSVETETGNLASPSTASDTSNSRLRKKWSPDGSWKYAYDVTPKVVIEVAMSQPMEDLTRKAVSLIEECSAKVVLGFHLGMDNSQRTNTVATVTKWTSRQDSEGVIKASSVSREFVSAEGSPAAEDESGPHLYLDDFFSNKTLNSQSEAEYDAILTFPPLHLNLNHLGHALVKVKEQEKYEIQQRLRLSPGAEGKVELDQNRTARKRQRDAEAGVDTAIDTGDRIGKRRR